jgi:hypothetical protein
MKKTILTIAVLVGVSAANFSIASDKVKENTSSIELVSSSELKFKLTLDSVKERSSLTIKDFNGDTFTALLFQNLRITLKSSICRTLLTVTTASLSTMAAKSLRNHS